MLKTEVKEKLQLPFVPDVYLVAVSGGRDSMCLLDICRNLGLNLKVLHVNHNLRSESQEESEFVEAYCQNHGLDYEKTIWEHPATTNIEGEARTFRYNFFAKVMKEYQAPVLLLAHHQDDQVETLLQDLIMTGNILRGIPILRPLANGVILRPLLDVSREKISQYMDNHKLTYMEDKSNYSDKFFRNRIRHDLLPWLVRENPKFKDSLVAQYQNNLAMQKILLDYGDDLLEQAALEDKIFDLRMLQTQIAKSCFIVSLEERLRNYFQISLNKEIQKQISKLLMDWTGTKVLRLNQKYQLVREYSVLKIEKIRIVEKKIEDVYTLDINKGIYLSNNEWIIVSESESFLLPPEISSWCKYTMKTTIKPTMVRYAIKGDKIQISPNMHKKISRIFIDEKIPRYLRSQIPIVLGENDKILSILPFRNAYLSKCTKTDKIYYITYYYYEG